MTEMVQSFEDLDVFKRAYRISLEVHRITIDLPKEEQYELGSQLRRASKSICANLAEGYAKQHISKAEFKRFILMALGSSEEMRVWLRYCLDLGYISESQWEQWRQEYTEISKMLSGLHNSWR
jgi:four helix bundle protein